MSDLNRILDKIVGKGNHTEFKDKDPQIDRILSQLKRLNELSDEELERRVQNLATTQEDAPK